MGFRLGPRAGFERACAREAAYLRGYPRPANSSRDAIARPRTPPRPPRRAQGGAAALPPIQRSRSRRDSSDAERGRLTRSSAPCVA